MCVLEPETDAALVEWFNHKYAAINNEDNSAVEFYRKSFISYDIISKLGNPSASSSCCMLL